MSDESWDTYAACPCGFLYRAAFGSLFHVHRDVCERCGRPKRYFKICISRIMLVKEPPVWWKPSTWWRGNYVREFKGEPPKWTDKELEDDRPIVRKLPGEPLYGQTRFGRVREIEQLLVAEVTAVVHQPAKHIDVDIVVNRDVDRFTKIRENAGG